MVDSDLDTQKELSEAINNLRNGHADKTVVTCQNFLITNPSSGAHIQLLAHALIKLGRLSDAQEQIEFAIKLTPDFAGLHEDLGSIQALKNNHDLAIDSFRRAVQIDPRLTSAHKKLAQCLAAIGKNDEVDEAFENYLDRDEDAALVASGAEHWRAGRITDAESTLKSALKKNVNNVDAMHFLALIYHDENKKLNDAEALLRRATEIAPDFKQAIASLGRLLLDNGKWSDAIRAYEKLIEIEPTDDKAWAGLGRSLSLAGQVEKAVTAYEKSLALNSTSPNVHMAYAHSLKTVGNQKEALVEYRQSIKLRPELGESYWSMANLKVFQFEASEIEAMELQIKSSELSDSARIHFLFSLGKAYEDRKDFSQAWNYYELGNNVQRGLLSYDPVANQMQLESIKKVFSHDFIDQYRHDGFSADDPIFIVGLPRSGSTLMEQILASHSLVEGTSELPNIGDIAIGTGRYRADGLTYPKTLRSLTKRDLKAYGREYLQQIDRHRTSRTPFFIDKMPNNFAHIGFIKLILPNAKIINTRRHPLDSCLGAYKQLFAKGQNFTYEKFELAQFYCDYIDIMNHWHKVFPGDILDVHYEETVTDLEKQTRKVLQFCGLDFEDQCLRYYETKRAVKTASSEQVRQPVYTSALGFWKNYSRQIDDWKEHLEDVIADLPDSVKSISGC
jgi:tetratricopeptide (TPR) repeat protein